VTNSADTASADADQLEVQKLSGGHFHYNYLGTTNEDRRFVYINPAGGITADWVIVPTASAYLATCGLTVFSYSTYPSSSATLYNSNPFSATLYGPNGQDLITSISCSNQKALSFIIAQVTTRPAYNPLRKVYFCQDYTLNYPQECTYEGLPLNSRYIIGKQSFAVNKRWQFTAIGLTRAEVQSLHQLPFLKTDLFWIYDSGGGQIPFRLLPCILENYSVQAVFDDKFSLALSVFEVETYQT